MLKFVFFLTKIKINQRKYDRSVVKMNRSVNNEEVFLNLVYNKIRYLFNYVKIWLIVKERGF